LYNGVELALANMSLITYQAGVELALTEPVGSGICATTLVVALVVLASPKKEVVYDHLLRNLKKSPKETWTDFMDSGFRIKECHWRSFLLFL
jgi:selenophosphate synthase